MNYLAHLLLGDGTPHALLGSLMADFVTRTDHLALPAGVLEGIRLHRRIDSFTDSHPVVQRSITRVGKRWGWFSGILIDVYYDHILAADWPRYSEVPLRDFADRVYGVLRDHFDLMPEDMRYAATRLIETDRLVSYARPEGIADALIRLSKRIAERIPNRAVSLEEAMPDLRAAHAELAADFHEFFPALQAFVRAEVERSAPDRR